MKSEGTADCRRSFWLSWAGSSWWSQQSEGGRSREAAGRRAAEDALHSRTTSSRKSKSRKAGETTALKRDGGKWQITAPKPLAADQDAAGSWSPRSPRSTPTKSIEEKAADLAPYGLDTPSLDVTVTRKDGKTDRLLIGDDTPTGSGAYAKLAGDPRSSPSPASTKTEPRQDAQRPARQAPAHLRFRQALARRAQRQGQASRVRQEQPERVADRQAAPAARRWLRRWKTWSAS